jgi:hypothetical protein
MKILKFLLTGLLITSFSSCVMKKDLSESRTTILPLGDTVKITDGSLIYGLPMTVLHFTVTLEHTFERPGPYAKYAGELIGLKDVINEENEWWTIKNIDFVTYEELDPSEFYIIKTNTLVQTNALLLKREGLILDINPEIYNKNISRTDLVTNEFRGFDFSDLGADEYYQVSRDTSYRVVEIDTAFIKIPYLVEKNKPLGIEKLAENAAKTLLDLRDGKQMILMGEANVFPQDPSAIAEMNRIENEYLTLFTGKTWTETITYNYDLIPDKSMEKSPAVLFKFSEMAGIINVSGTGGTPVTVEFVPANKTRDIVMIDKPQSDPESVNKYDRLFYRIPDVVDIRVSSNKKIINESRKLIYQFGTVVQLPSNYILGN